MSFGGPGMVAVLRLHGFVPRLCALLLLALVIGALLHTSYGISDMGAGTTSLAALGPAIAGILIGATARSSAPDLETLTPLPRAAAIVAGVIVATGIGAGLLYVGIWLTFSGGDQSIPLEAGSPLVRAYIAWTGITLWSTIIGGRSRSWLLPSLLLAAALLFGYDDRGNAYTWNIVGDGESWARWVIALATLLSGALATVVTLAGLTALTWRRATRRFTRRRAKRIPSTLEV